MLRAVIDTNVLFTGLTRRGPDADIVDAWVARRFVPCVSAALGYEYLEVLSKKLGPVKRDHALGAVQALLDRAEFVPIWTRVRPLSRDPDDDFVIECALNVNAILVTQNLRDLIVARQALGVPVHTPSDFMTNLEAHHG